LSTLLLVCFWRCVYGHRKLTISEEITGIDIVAAQIQIAAGVTLEQLGLTQENIHRRGFAIQCRITTEDAAAGFQPDTGKIEVYRSAGGNGVRLDASSGYAGAQITVSSLAIKQVKTDRIAPLRFAPCQVLR
jgi:pyruvate carboxylase